MYKLIVSDFDRTLINDKEEIPTSTIILLDELRKKGVKFAVATGRCIQSVSYYNRDFPFIDYLITANGAYVYDTKDEKLIYKKNIMISAVKKIIKEYYDKSIIYLIDDKTWNLISNESAYDEDYDVVKRSDYKSFIDENKSNIYKMEIYFKSLKKAKEAVKNINEMNLKIKVNLQIGIAKYLIEVTDISVDKYKGVEKVIKKMKINNGNVIAFGDGYNDMELIKNVGLGVAVDNAVTDLKKIAKEITTSNNDKGIEKFMNKIKEKGLI